MRLLYHEDGDELMKHMIIEQVENIRCSKQEFAYYISELKV